MRFGVLEGVGFGVGGVEEEALKSRGSMLALSL